MQTDSAAPVLVASCHCGAVRIELSDIPTTVTECNCSVCRRYGALWAYYIREQITLHAAANELAGYSWGDRQIVFRHCRSCGCLTHYESVEHGPGGRFALNARMLPREVMAALPVRHFDGADSWQYLD
jgi:hypothetical protein